MSNISYAGRYIDRYLPHWLTIFELTTLTGLVRCWIQFDHTYEFTLALQNVFPSSTHISWINSPSGIIMPASYTSSGLFNRHSRTRPQDSLFDAFDHFKQQRLLFIYFELIINELYHRSVFIWPPAHIGHGREKFLGRHFSSFILILYHNIMLHLDNLRNIIETRQH
jgi:hypothetical protein